MVEELRDDHQACGSGHAGLPQVKGAELGGTEFQGKGHMQRVKRATEGPDPVSGGKRFRRGEEFRPGNRHALMHALGEGGFHLGDQCVTLRPASNRHGPPFAAGRSAFRVRGVDLRAAYRRGHSQGPPRQPRVAPGDRDSGERRCRSSASEAVGSQFIQNRLQIGQGPAPEQGLLVRKEIRSGGGASAVSQCRVPVPSAALGKG
jgi:hypothetical protein